MSELQCVDGMKYAPVGKCIYCGSTDDLTDEHIIPFALSGTAVLPDSSCRTCATLTGKMEQEVLRGEMQQLRVFAKLKSRTKHKDAPKTKEVRITDKDGKTQTVTLGFTEAPVVFSFPDFDLPGFLKPEGYIGGIRLNGMATYVFGPSPDEYLRNAKASEIKWEGNYKCAAFARMIAKIGYSTAIAQARAAGIQELFREIPEVVQSILGHKDEIGRWVGTMANPMEKRQGMLHRIEFGDVNNREMTAVVQLFADSDTPFYGVILGLPANKS